MNELHDVGISIEGIGTELVSGNKGLVFGYSGEVPTTSDYTWSDGLTEPPTPGKDEADPRTGDMTLGGFTAKIHARPSFRRLLLARQDFPVYKLVNGITAAATSIELSATNITGAIWLGDETMRIVSSSGTTYTVERGFWGSDAGIHGAGAGVYTRPPYYHNRLVTFWKHNGLTMTRRGRGYFKKISTEQAQTRIVISIEGPLTAMQGVTRMRFNPALEGELRCANVQADDGPTLLFDWDSTGWTSSVAKAFDASGNAQSVWYSGGGGTGDPKKLAYVQMDGAIEPLVAIFGGGSYGGPEFTEKIQGNRFNSDEVGQIEDPVYELAVWNSRIPKAPYPIADAETVFDNAFQPLAVCAALLCSGDADQIDPAKLDFVNGNLGLGIGWLIGDVGRQAFIDLANEDSGISIDQLYLGWDGEPVDVLDEVLSILISHGYWLAPNVDGFLIPRRFEALDVKTFAEALSNQVELLYKLKRAPKVIQEPGYGLILQTYTASIGKTPIFDGTTVQGNAIGASARIDKMIDPQKNDLDFNTWQTDRIDGVAGIIATQAAFMQVNMPTLRIDSNDWNLEGLNYDIGEWCTLKVPDGSDAVLYDEEGEDVSAAQLSEHPFAMLITGRGWNPKTDAYELDGLLVNFSRQPGRFIAPEMVVESSSRPSGRDEIILRTLDEGRVGDVEEFTKLQQVQLYDSDMVLREGTVLTVFSIASTTMVVDGTFTNPPAQGDIIRLAEFDDYTFKDFGTLRGYAYLADDNDTLGTINEDADIWQ